MRSALGARAGARDVQSGVLFISYCVVANCSGAEGDRVICCFVENLSLVL